MSEARELDWAVWEKVFGNGVMAPGDIHDAARKIILADMPHYSTDIQEALKVVEEMRSRGDGVRFSRQPDGQEHSSVWSVGFASPGYYWKGADDVSLPAAICRAALAVVEREEKMEEKNDG